jgi:hypothetical protein
MASVHYRDAYIIVDGAALRASFSELSIEMGSETLDETAFGDTTRTNKGGLLTGSVSGRGHCEFGANEVEAVLFALVGVDGTPVVVFPDGITPGSSQAGTGYAMLGVVDVFKVGGAVGTLLPFEMSMQTRGVVP